MITLVVNGKGGPMLLFLSGCLVRSGGVVRVALELVPTLEDLSGSNTPQGNTEHLGTLLPGKLLSPSKLELIGKVSPLPLMS